jgi:glycosyltransferase involved in cell wall biosynthesis
MEATVLMPVLNGATHLEAQLDSLARQSLPPGRLIVSDDGSRDDSGNILRRFAQKAPFEVRLSDGPRRGYAANVMALLDAAPDGPVAFCDQDDIWLPDRIERGMGAVARLNQPGLHVVARRPFGRTGARRDRRAQAGERPFATALVQNLAPANATLLNPAAAAVMRDGAARLSALPAFPDWWIFGVVTGMEGTVVHDAAPGILYRTHGGNVLGTSRSLSGVRRRIGYLCDGTFGDWLRQNTRALLEVAELLTPPAQERLHRFSAALEAGRGRDWLALSDRRGACEKMLLKLASGLGLI